MKLNRLTITVAVAAFAFTLGLPCLCTAESAQNALISGERLTQSEGTLVCVSKQDLEQMMSLLADHDKVAVAKMVGTGRCGVLNGGVHVYIMESTWGGYVKIRPKGGIDGAWTLSKYLRFIQPPAGQ